MKTKEELYRVVLVKNFEELFYNMQQGVRIFRREKGELRMIERFKFGRTLIHRHRYIKISFQYCSGCFTTKYRWLEGEQLEIPLYYIERVE